MPARISLAGPQSDVQGRMATTATTGTGTLTLGAASPNATTFAGMPVPIADGDTLTYELVDIGVSPPGKEKGRGTYHAAGPTLSRDAVIWSTNGNAKLNLSGNAFVFVTADEGDVVLASQARTLLAAPATFWFDPASGNDANAGTNTSPWATPAPLFSRYDFGGQQVTLTLKNNTTSPVALAPWSGGGSLVLELNGKSVTTVNSSAVVISGLLPGTLTIQNGTLAGTGTSNISASGAVGIQFLGGGQCFISNITFGACTTAYGWISGLGGGQPSLAVTGPISFAATAAGQSYMFFVAASALFTTGQINGAANIGASGNLTVVNVFGVNLAGSVVCSPNQWHLNGHTVTVSSGSNNQLFQPSCFSNFQGFA
jgi:hypothetical protein